MDDRYLFDGETMEEDELTLKSNFPYYTSNESDLNIFETALQTIKKTA